LFIIQIKNVTKKYSLGKFDVPALCNISLDINKGDFVTIAGPSGSGKSTLLNLIGCIDKPSLGEIIINDVAIGGMSDKKLNRLRSKYIGFIFQSFNLIPVLNVYENIELPLLIHGDITVEEKRRRIDHFIKEVGLEKVVRHKPSELSGGQQQRVAVARALVTKPQIVIADEPTANLDSRTGLEIINLMHEINKKEMTTFIFSSHDPKVISKADRIINLIDGRIVGGESV
jgi:putative ABC transport system ATP-binding protein